MKKTWTRNRYRPRVDILPTVLIGASWLAIWLVWPSQKPQSFEPLRPFSSIRYMPGLVDTRPAASGLTHLSGAVHDPELKDSQFINLLKTHPYDFLAYVPRSGPTPKYEIPEKPLAEQAALGKPLYKPVFERIEAALPPVERSLISWSAGSSLKGLAFEMPEEISALQYGPAWRISARVESDAQGQITEVFLLNGSGDPALNAAALRRIRRSEVRDVGQAVSGVVTIVFEGKEKPAEKTKPNEEANENKN